MSLDLCLVIPAYNEEDCIAQVLKQWQAAMLKLMDADAFRMVVVNDGSKDQTGKILDALVADIPQLVVVHQPNGGHGQAVVHGYRQALKLAPDFVFQTDSDDQFEADDFALLWEKRNQSQMILGYRKVRHDAPIRLVITNILKYAMYLIYGTYIQDANIPFRLFKATFLKQLLDCLPAETPFAPNIFLSVLGVKSGQEPFHIPVHHKDRATGEVSIRKFKLFKVSLRSFIELARFRWDLSRAIKSLK